MRVRVRCLLGHPAIVWGGGQRAYHLTETRYTVKRRIPASIISYKIGLCLLAGVATARLQRRLRVAATQDVMYLFTRKSSSPTLPPDLTSIFWAFVQYGPPGIVNVALL